MKTNLLYVLSLVLFISSCGGGDSSSGSQDNISTQPDINSGVVLTSQTIVVNLPSSLDNTESYRLVTSYSDVINLNTEYETFVERYNLDEMAIVLDQNDNVVLLGYLAADGDNHVLSGRSTALALLANYPSLASTYNKNPELFLSSIVAFDEVKVLADKINSVASWSLGEDGTFIAAYADAVLRVYTAIENGYFNVIESATAEEATLTSSIRALVSLDGATVKKSESESDTRSGVTIYITGEKTVSDNPQFSVAVSNNLSRYVTIVVGNNDHPHGKRTFMMRPDEESIKTEYYSTELLLNATDEYVYAYGPGKGPLLEWVDKEEEYFLTPAVMSLVEYFVIPTIQSRYNVKSECLKRKWLTGSDGTIINSSVLNTLNVSAGLIKGNWEYVGVNLTTYANAFLTKEISECMEENIIKIAGDEGVAVIDELLDVLRSSLEFNSKIKIINNLVGPVGNLLAIQEAAEKFYSISPEFNAVLNDARMSENWLLTNKQKPNEDFSIKINNPETVATIFEIQIGDYKYGFDGVCPLETSCRHLAYQRQRPAPTEYSFDFSAKCDNWGESVDCRNVVFDIVGGDRIGGTKEIPTSPLNGTSVSYGFPYKTSVEGKKTYNGTLSAADYDGAYADYGFTLQIEEAKPDLVVMVDGEKYVEGENSVFKCGSSDTSISKKITIVNKGLGLLYFEGIPKATTSGQWSLDSAFNDVVLEHEKSTSRILEYSCNGALSDQWRHDFQDQYASTVYKKDVIFTVTDECSNASAPIIHSATYVCDAENWGIDVSFEDPIGARIGGGSGGFDGTNYPTRLWVNDSQGNWYVASNANSVSLIDGDNYNGTVRVSPNLYYTPAPPFCLHEELWRDVKVGITNICELETQTAIVPVYYK